VDFTKEGLQFHKGFIYIAFHQVKINWSWRKGQTEVEDKRETFKGIQDKGKGE